MALINDASIKVDENASVDPTTRLRIIEVDNYVWDAIGLTWVKETQPGGGGGGGGPVTIADGAAVTLGALADAAVGDAAGSVNAHIRQIAKTLIAGIAVSFAAAQHVIVDSITAAVDVSDRAARLLGHVTVDNFPATQPVSGTVAVSSMPNEPNFDVALSTRTKPADQQHAIVDSGTLTAVTAITNALPAGTNVLGHVVVDSGAVTVTDASQLPASLGQKAMAASLPVVIASDQSVVPENLSQVGGAAFAIKPLPAGGIGFAALPVYANAIQLLTYTYGVRVIATGVLTANTAKAILSIDHAVGSVKTVRIRRIIVAGRQSTILAGALDIEVSTGTLQATVGTVITAGKRNQGDTGAECVVRSLPTITAATMQDILPFAYDASAAVNAQPATVIYDWQEGGETKPWTLRAGVLESFVLNAISDAAQSWILSIHVTLTEE